MLRRSYTSLVVTIGFLICPLIYSLDCPGGQFVAVNAVGNEVCRSCEEDTYKEGTNNATACTPCPASAPRNLQTGSDSAADCQYGDCGQGQEYSEGEPLNCTDCDFGYYQDKTYPLLADACQQCSGTMSTPSEGSTSANCAESCESGQQYNSDTGQCEDCPINFYKNNTVSLYSEYSRCVQCPSSDYRTLSTGATSAADCNIVTCGRGYYTDVDANQCVPCPQDQYQNMVWKETCNRCPTNYGTFDNETIHDDIDKCHRICQSGYQIEAAGCVQCPRGTYKDHGEDRFGFCIDCPSGFTTSGPASANASACSEVACQRGNYRVVASNTCVPCGVGSYQLNQWQTSCTDCTSGKTTVSTGSTASSDCKTIRTSLMHLDLETKYPCRSNENITDSYSTLYSQQSESGRQLVNTEVGTLPGIHIVRTTTQFKGFRCFTDLTINMLFMISLETTDTRTTETIVEAVRTHLLSNMADDFLNDTVGSLPAMEVKPDGLEVVSIGVEALDCSTDGFFTNLTAQECQRCHQGFYNPTGVPELCFPCPLGLITAGRGAFGERDALCLYANPDDYSQHTFIVEIASTLICTTDFINTRSQLYRTTSSNTRNLVLRVLEENLAAQYRLDTPEVTFIGYRCNSPVEILLEVVLVNVQGLADTVMAAIDVLNDEMSDGTLSDPTGTLEPLTVNGQQVQFLSVADLECPAGQQTSMANSACEPCPQGTYQPEGVPELCYACPEGLTTVGTGTVLPSGNLEETVCTVVVTEAPPEEFTYPEAGECRLYLLQDVCVTNCPSGYTPNADRVCELETRSNGNITKIGIVVTSVLGGVLFLLLVGFCSCLAYNALCRDSNAYGDKGRFLDTPSGERRSRSRPRRSRYADQRSEGYSSRQGTSWLPRGRPYSPNNYF